MPRLMRYEFPAAVPPHLEAQIRSLVYAEWPGADETDAALTLIDPGLHPVHFVLAEGVRVLSYARTIRATVPHLGQSFKLYGLGDVVTQPELRHKGYGGRVVDEATTYIKFAREVDAAVLLTEPKLEPFYRRSGWDYIPGLRVETGESGECAAAAIIPMVLFLSAKACAARTIFLRETLVLPGDEW